MSRSLRKSRSLRCCSLLEVKSKYGAEFRRFSLDRLACGKYKDFYKLVVCLHHLRQADVVLAYADVHGELLPINNDDNLGKALTSTQYLLRIFVQLQEEAEQESRGVDGLTKRKKPVSHRFQISLPQNFRPVSSIIDVDIVPESHRRVRLYHQGSDRPLGFYIRDGASVRVTRYGLEKVPGIFISRIVPGGLADCTGLLAINDEVLEVNGIDVLGKSLDQVTDMMIANSHKLIVTVKPANQRNNIRRKSGSSGSGFMESMSSVSYPGLPVIMKAYCAEFESEDVDVVVESPVASLSWLSSSSTSSFSPCLKAPYSPNVSGRHHPAVRERSSSTQDVLNTWHVDLTRNLLLPQTAMEEDGIIVIL